MALRAVPDHPKFAQLKVILGQPKGPVAGWLEMMWHFTGRFTPQGNIGKYTDTAIEAWVEWNGEPGALIAALVKSGWIDHDPVHRLLVHDWAQHADKATKNALMRAKMAFCSPGVRTPYPETASPYRLPVPEPVPEPEPGGSTYSAPATEDEIPEGLADLQYAAAVMEKAAIVHTFSLAQKFAQALNFISKLEECSKPQATLRMLERVNAAQLAGDVKWGFWLDDEQWKRPARASPVSVGVWDGKSKPAETPMQGWERMFSDKWRRDTEELHREGKPMTENQAAYIRDLEVSV
jgi:hypothetical protein